MNYRRIKLRKNIIFVLFLFSINLLGCTGGQKITDAMTSWVGHHQSELIAVWGPPDRTDSDGMDGKILIYEKFRILEQTKKKTHVGESGYITYTKAKKRGYTATRMFYVNSEGIIYSWHWHGL